MSPTPTPTPRRSTALAVQRAAEIADRDASDLLLPVERKAPAESRLWIRWATTPHPCGGGVAEDAADLQQLPADLLLVAVVAYLEWLAAPVELGDDLDDEHPLVGEGAGRRRQRKPLREWSIRSRARAVERWAAATGAALDYPAADLVKMADLSGATVKQRRVPVTETMLVVMLDRLDNDDVVTLSTPELTRAWHARAKAALLVRVWGVLRTGEVLELSDEFEVRAWGLQLRLVQPKVGHERIVRLPHRPGCRLDPIAALYEWFVAAAALDGFDRGGLLLPLVRRRHIGGSYVGAGMASEYEYWNLLLVAADLVDELGENDLLGPHNLRAVLPTAASQAGKTLPFLQALGGWARGSVTPGLAYDRSGADRQALAADTLDAVAS